MSHDATILIVDDDNAHRTMLRALVGGWGYRIIEANDGQRAIATVKKGALDLVLMDVRMLRVSGLEALTVIKKFNPTLPVILMTAYASVEMAVEALKKDAYDYLTKPLDFDKLKLTLKRALEHQHLKTENRRLKARLAHDIDRGNIIGHSPAMEKLLETVAQVSPSEATILITGESGTGKELIANAIHFNSARRSGSFVKLNCAAITETLLESELFGHEKGSFTGANRKKEGRFVQASGGTLFLDEVSEMPPSMQVKLLRVLQEQEITRVGGENVIPVDVRIVAATNHDLYQRVKSQKFREDLYYRLNVVSLELPPLRKRREDIPLLVQHFVKQLSRRNHKTIRGVTPRCMDSLVRNEWPGNVRELMNAVERGIVLAQTDMIHQSDLGLQNSPPPQLPVSNDAIKEMTPDRNAFVSLVEVEKTAILKTLKATNGNKSEASRRLGITRKTLQQKLKKYGVIP